MSVSVRMPGFTLRLLGLAFFCFFSAGCGKFRLQSRWLDRDIVIDGDNSEWQDVKTYFKEKKVALAVFNDSNFLYLQLVSWDKNFRRRVLESGFTVWFDTKGGSSKDFGIRFPVGISDSAPNDFTNRPGRREKIELDGMEEALLNEMEVVSSRGDESKKGLANFFKEKGVEVKLARQEHNLVYELKLPLARSIQHPYAVEAKAGKVISIGLEVSRSDLKLGGKPKGRMARADIAKVGPMPERRGGPGKIPGAGQRRPYRDSGALQEFNLWLKVKLAPKTG